MAAKPVATGHKRKAAPKSQNQADSKKARFDKPMAARKKQDEPSDDSSGSDSEEGGVQLDAAAPGKDNSNANALDRCKF